MATALSALTPGTIILNDDSLGGWLLLTQPNLTVAVDTRTYLYDYDYLVALAVRGGSVRDGRRSWRPPAPARRSSPPGTR